MIRLGCAYYKIGVSGIFYTAVRPLMLHRKFCDKISDKNYFDSNANEIKQSSRKLESEIEQQNNKLNLLKAELHSANFEELQTIFQQFDNKFALVEKEINRLGEEINPIVNAFEKLETNVRILKKHVQEKQDPKMEEEKRHSGKSTGHKSNGGNDEKQSKYEIVDMKNNIWNAADCGKELWISDIFKHVVHCRADNEYNCVRAEYPIPKFNLAAKKPSIVYFEVGLGDYYACPNCDHNYQIGFCTQEFPLEKGDLGQNENSIGICDKGGIWIDGSYIEFENDYENGHLLHVGDGIGLGIIHSPENASLKCFATLCHFNKFLGIVELPAKFANLQLFPAANLGSDDAKIDAIFDQEKWNFDFNKLP